LRAGRRQRRARAGIHLHRYAVQPAARSGHAREDHGGVHAQGFSEELPMIVIPAMDWPGSSSMDGEAAGLPIPSMDLALRASLRLFSRSRRICPACAEMTKAERSGISGAPAL